MREPSQELRLFVNRTQTLHLAVLLERVLASLLLTLGKEQAQPV